MCGCPYHEGGNHLTPGYSPSRRKYGHCKSPDILPFPLVRGGGIETDIPVGFGIDTAAIGGARAFLPAGAGRRFAAGERAAPFPGMLLWAVAPVDHTETSHA